MDNLQQDLFNHSNQHATQRLYQDIQQGEIQLGLYKNRGRVAKIHADSFYLEGLKNSPQQDIDGQNAFALTNWLLDKPRLFGEQRQNYLLSTVDTDTFSGFEFHPQHRLWVDSFNSPHHWRDGEPRSQAQIVDLLLPSGQWHRHYDTVILANDANDQQVELIRHWLELTGGSVVIIEDDERETSLPIQQLLSDLDPISIDEKPLAAQQPQQCSGMLVTAVQPAKQIEDIHYPISSLNHYKSGLPDHSSSTTWVYEGVITAPESDDIRIYVDTLRHTDDLILEIGQHVEKIDKHDTHGEIILNDIKDSQQIPFKITTTTQGPAPQIRLGWGFQNMNAIQLIPHDAIHYTPPPVSDNLSVAPPLTKPAIFNPHGIHHIVSLPSSSINSFALTQDTLKNSHYFSLVINSSRQNIALRLDDIALSASDSWHEVAIKIETEVNQQLVANKLPPVTLQYSQGRLLLECEGMIFSQFQLKDRQRRPILIVENPNGKANQLVIGAISGSLPTHDDIDYFQLIESPLFGKIELNSQTGEWVYLPDESAHIQGNDQFDVSVVMKDGSVSAPISIQLQSENAPDVSIPGQRTFTLPDPIYHQPELRHYKTPADMQVLNVQMAQTHLLAPDSPHFTLTANRWALLKVDLISPSAANAPDIVAIIRDKSGIELERVILTGPQKLPTNIDERPKNPSIEAQDLHRHSYTAPISGKWIQPEVKIQIMAGNKPIIQPYTDESGQFSPKITTVTPMVSHVTNTSFYRQGHGTYAYSPLSWGLEANAKLPTHRFSLFSYPALTKQPSLYPYVIQNEKGYTDTTTLVHPLYDAPDAIDELAHSQIDWAYRDSQNAARRTKLYSEFFYSSVKRLPSSNGTSDVIGLATHHFGGGITSSGILWHETFGHGLSLGHTTSSIYPYGAESHGENIAFDQYRQQYTTYFEKDQNSKIMPAMYPMDYAHFTEQYDAFLPHSDALTRQAQQFLSRINERNVPREYLPVYQLDGIFLPQFDGSLHPYSQLSVTETIGHVIANDHANSEHSLRITYMTRTGLLTETIKTALDENTLNVNIPNKGELVSIDIIKTEDESERSIYGYKNPESLANRLFIYGDGQTIPQKLQRDNYWRGSKLFWAHDKDNQALRATWVENGRLNQQYFSLKMPFNQHQVNTEAKFTPLNHLNLYSDSQSVSEIHILSDVRLLSDVQINQQIDIKQLGIQANSDTSYWVSLLVYDERGELQEYAPLEAWYLSVQDDTLIVKGAIDSTPNLNIAGIKVHIDSHLQDDAAASTILIQQNKYALAENREWLNYDRPVEFNSLISHIAGMKEDTMRAQQQAYQWAEAVHFVPLAA
ncbi:hypothetical protein [Providencia sp. PROV202]|uniref:hypothetical protein n=1 Tax=Providencia sp. PROV202 TaxID=2949902 RepID=UPI00234942EE|nr:hypothetical protein [Providencia sp. PROV202]